MTRQPLLTRRCTESFVYAAELHAEQVRKSTGVSYIAHLMAVSAIVIENGGTEDDAIEDQGGDATRQEIIRRFGPKVAAVIDGCTDAETVPKPPWRERKEAHIAHLVDASPSMCLVSSADKLHNVRAILSDYRRLGEALWTRFTGGRDGTLWYYRALVDTFRAVTASPIIEELDCTVAELERLTSQPLEEAGTSA